MSIAIVDVNGWQNVLDLKSGKKRTEDTPLIRLVRQVLDRHPYPGDTDLRSNTWVTDTALDMLEQYNPQLVFLSYAQQYFAARYTRLPDIAWDAMIDEIFSEIERFVRQSGFTPIIIGNGDMITIEGWIDLTKLDGAAVCTSCSTRYAGLYNASRRDLEYVHNLQQVERVVSKAEFIREFDGYQEVVRHLPEYLVVAKAGYCFKTPAVPQPVMMPARNEVVPIYTELGKITDITGICEHIRVCGGNRKIALFVLEGIGIKHFRLPYQECDNRLKWFCYEPGVAQYLAISCGKHQLFQYPAGYRQSVEADINTDYPFSGKFEEMPAGTLGEKFVGKSIAIGNRSMFMHTVAGVDISIECFARNLNNLGCLAVIHKRKVGQRFL